LDSVEESVAIDLRRAWESEGEAVNISLGHISYNPFQPLVDATKWYALATMSRHERLVVYQLKSQGIDTFLPTVLEIHRWSDRRKRVELPLFPGYVFLHASLSPRLRRCVTFARGTAGLISMQGEPVAIPDEQIESIQKLLSNNVQFVPYPYLKTGQRVRIRGGSLDGIEGILTRCNGESGLVVSIDGISRSLALRIEGYDVELA
jgi:transcription antitermination factor NusG